MTRRAGGESDGSHNPAQAGATPAAATNPFTTHDKTREQVAHEASLVLDLVFHPDDPDDAYLVTPGRRIYARELRNLSHDLRQVR